VAALIVSNDAEAVFQSQNLVKPHALAAAETVQQHHRRAGANIADGNGEAADLDFSSALHRSPRAISYAGP
jgi:hypothetical protein